MKTEISGSPPIILKEKDAFIAMQEMSGNISLFSMQNRM